MREKGIARLSRYGETRRNRYADAGHIRKIGAFASEESAHTLPRTSFLLCLVDIIE